MKSDPTPKNTQCNKPGCKVIFPHPCHSTTDDSVSAPTDVVGDWRSRFDDEFPSYDSAVLDTDRRKVIAFIASELENARTQERAKTLLDATGVLHKHAMKTKNTADLDLIEQMQAEILSLLSKTD